MTGPLQDKPTVASDVEASWNIWHRRASHGEANLGQISEDLQDETVMWLENLPLVENGTVRRDLPLALLALDSTESKCSCVALWLPEARGA